MLSGLRKMVSGNVNTPATVRASGKTPILSKSASKRKFDSYDGLSAKAKYVMTCFTMENKENWPKGLETQFLCIGQLLKKKYLGLGFDTCLCFDRKEITSNLPQKELTFTPMKM